ncbi:uncharacterized protein LY79DRAFT_172606 [Colletotrichum navitas]|uniref:Uncharacterized protein n=1 Tax=Colletotrichum navitas TaxID=681940 RepID=A0AAD8Q1D1_9PEZI|nr:uncharacterized protein LY79DRAFT_172606 [Colletotrichum navitas]KAK1593873.1 hypothetical protein LY79DRAFT_172606 [Colletotrichum navitas]
MMLPRSTFVGSLPDVQTQPPAQTKAKTAIRLSSSPRRESYRTPPFVDSASLPESIPLWSGLCTLPDARRAVHTGTDVTSRRQCSFPQPSIVDTRRHALFLVDLQTTTRLHPLLGGNNNNHNNNTSGPRQRNHSSGSMALALGASGFFVILFPYHLTSCPSNQPRFFIVVGGLTQSLSISRLGSNVCRAAHPLDYINQN